MNPITPSASTPSSSTPASTTGVTNSSQALDKNTFLKLMMVQMQNQDPLNPSDPTQYMGELAAESGRSRDRRSRRAGRR